MTATWFVAHLPVVDFQGAGSNSTTPHSKGVFELHLKLKKPLLVEDMYRNNNLAKLGAAATDTWKPWSNLQT